MTTYNALIIDDERDICELIEMSLLSQKVNCDSAYTVKQGISRLKKGKYSFVICDLKLPDGDGMDVLRHIQKHYPKLPVCMITAHGSMESAIEALRLGAFDFISKPLELKSLRNMCASALKLVAQDSGAVEKPAIARQDNVEPSTGSMTLIGNSRAMENIRQMVNKVARSQAPVLINGESGTGKEVVARMIHAHSPRSEGAFVPVNCGALPENLIESELFGYKKGSFTGAERDHDGLFVAANGGTLFLDEIADLPLPMQVKLLRAIQERAIRPVGSANEQKIDVRIISATHQDLKQAVSDGQFREDLYYRLNVIRLCLPPLRERREDIHELSEHLLKRLCARNGRPLLSLSDDAVAYLQHHSFSGNVRELENLLERGLTFAEGDVITADDISFVSDVHEVNADDTADVHESDEEDGYTDDDGLPENLEAHMNKIEKNILLKALQVCNGNKTQAAERLGITFRAMRYKLDKHGIE